MAIAGRSDEAGAILDELRARPPGAPTAVSEAWLLGVLGKIDDAFDLLAGAEKEYQGILGYTGLPGFDPIRSDGQGHVFRLAAISASRFCTCRGEPVL